MARGEIDGIHIIMECPKCGVRVGVEVQRTSSRGYVSQQHEVDDVELMAAVPAMIVHGLQFLVKKLWFKSRLL